MRCVAISEFGSGSSSRSEEREREKGILNDIYGELSLTVTNPPLARNLDI